MKRRATYSDTFGSKLAQHRIDVVLDACTGLSTKGLEQGFLEVVIQEAAALAAQSPRLRKALEQLEAIPPAKLRGVG